MRSKRAALAIVLALVIAACGGDGGEATTTAADATTPPATEATTPPATEETTATSAPGETPTEMASVRFRLNWVIAGNHAPYFLAKKEGFWEACGLDVTLNAGQGSGDTAQLVGTGAEEFGLTDAVSISAGRSQGLPIKSIGVIYQDNPSSLVSYVDTGIEELADVEGKTYGAVPGGSPYLLLHALWEENGIDVDSIREVSVPAPGIAQLKTRQVDFITFFGNEVVNIEADTSLLNVLFFRDFGLESYGLALAASDDYIAENPNAVQCFVDGVRQGFEAAAADPEAALQALYEAAPETEQAPEVHQAMLEGAFEFAGDDLLSQNLEKWTATHDFLFEAGVIEEAVDPAELFTDEFGQ
ncbi:MAG TPA: ABC transporter substrate-binding protein [Acidimicrobiia bacterium]